MVLRGFEILGFIVLGFVVLGIVVLGSKFLGFFILILRREDRPESQKPHLRVGIADRKVSARLESFCASGKFLRVVTKLTIKQSLNINIRVNMF